MLGLLLVILIIVVIVAVSRGGKKKKLEIQHLKKQSQQGNINVSDELAKLHKLKEDNVISEEEYNIQKQKLLS